MNVTLLSEQDLPEILQLLRACHLPTADVATSKPVFLGVLEGSLLGVVGVERLGQFGLLRSLAVQESARGRGLGTRLAGAAEEWAAAQGVEHLYLLTTTAEKFFAAREYTVQPRDQVPEPIRGTTEFSSACPASAAVMHRRIARVKRILVLCTGNSARSQIAEALLTRKSGGRFEVSSAGSRPAARVNPLAVQVLRDAGIDWSNREPRGIESVADQHWDMVITVCDRAREACPILPGTPVFAHWGMPDPAEVEGDDATRLRAFSETLIMLNRRIDLFMSGFEGTVRLPE